MYSNTDNNGSLISGGGGGSSSSSSSNNNHNIIDIPEGAAIIGFIATILICIIGIIGNLITIIALIKQQINHQNSHHSSTTTIFVINLAIADLLFCSLVMPLQSGRYLTRSWPFGQLLCRLYPLFYYGTVATSLMMITAITINRFILIAFNRHYSRIYNRKNVIIMIIFCWLFSYTLVSIPVLKLYGQTGYQSNTFSCTILRDQRERSPKKFLFILGFFLPMTTIVFCYGMILFHIKRQQHKRQTKTTQNNGTIMINNNNTTNRDLRLTLLICVVFGAFLACFLPLFIGNVFIPDDRYPYFHVFASIFAWMNSCINPFIYFVMNQRYRQAYKKLFFGNFFFKNHHHHHHHML
nr:protein trapped in endoderm-1-like [Dermatophagoides farinae]